MSKLEIIQDEIGNQIVLIPDIIFTNKQNIDWNEVEEYLKQYIGEIIEIAGKKGIILSFILLPFPLSFIARIIDFSRWGVYTPFVMAVIIIALAVIERCLYEKVK